MAKIVISRGFFSHYNDSTLRVEAAELTDLKMLMAGLRAIGFNVNSVCDEKDYEQSCGKSPLDVEVMPGQLAFIENLGRRFCDPAGDYDDSQNDAVRADLEAAIEHALDVTCYAANPDGYDEPPRPLDHYVGTYA